ncbi:hypothetical protein [Peribacillus muralis]|nr:hypothetical protein [Peribacillus muralis]
MAVNMIDVTCPKAFAKFQARLNYQALMNVSGKINKPAPADQWIHMS